MSGNFDVNLDGKKISIRVGDQLKDIKEKLGKLDNTIFENVDLNNNGELEDFEPME